MSLNDRTVDARVAPRGWSWAVSAAVLTAAVGLTAPAQTPPPPAAPKDAPAAQPADAEAIKTEMAAAAKAGDVAKVRALADKLDALAGRGVTLPTIPDNLFDRVMPQVQANGFAIMGGPWRGYSPWWPSAVGYQVSPQLWVAGPDVAGWRRAVEGLKKARAELKGDLKDKPEAVTAIDQAIAGYERRIAAAAWVADWGQPAYPRAIAAVGPIPPMMPMAVVVPSGGVWVTADGQPVAVAAMRKRMAESLAEYTKQIDGLKDKPEAQAAARQAMAAYETAMTAAVAALEKATPRADGVVRAGGVGEPVRVGIQPERIPGVVLAQLDVPAGQGVMVAQVMPGTPAEAVGLRSNDILLTIGGTPIPDDPDAVGKVVRELKAGQPLDVAIIRKGKPMTLKGLSLPAVAAATGR